VSGRACEHVQKRYEGAEDHFNMFLEESLARQRNEMMDNFY
jgi:hypothetical protein